MYAGTTAAMPQHDGVEQPGTGLIDHVPKANNRRGRRSATLRWAGSRTAEDVGHRSDA